MFSKKQLARLIWPLIVEQFLAVAIGMADTVMVTSCGEAAVAGVSLVDSINVLLINIFSALATGGAILASQYIGRQDHEQANKAAKQLVLVTAGISLLVMGLCLIANHGILHLVFGEAEADVMSNSETYFFWSALSYPFLAMYNAGAALFRAMGNSRVSMLTSLLMNLLNIGGNALLIYGVKMGVAGAAIASLVSRFVGAVIMLALLRFRHQLIRLDSLIHLGFHPHMIKQILGVGIPNGLENGMFQIGKILVQRLITALGTVSISANAVANTVAALPQIPGAAIGLAMITVVGQCIGAGEQEQAKSYTLRLTGLAYASMSVLCILEVIFVAPIVGCFNLLPETASLARQLLIYHGVTCLLMWPASFVLPNGLRAAGDVRFTMLVSVLSMWIFRIGFSYLLVDYLQMGVLGVWVAMTIDWLVRLIVFAVRLFTGGWRNKHLI